MWFRIQILFRSSVDLNVFSLIQKYKFGPLPIKQLNMKGKIFFYKIITSGVTANKVRSGYNIIKFGQV